MIRMFFLKNTVIYFAAVVSTFSLLTYDAEAQVKPFKINGEGVAPLGLPLPGQDARRCDAVHPYHRRTLPHGVLGTRIDLARFHAFETLKEWNE